jgi:hypothetical protein
LQFKEERVRVDSCFGAERDPTAPDSVPFFVGFFLLRIKDDSMVRRARMAKEEISLGSGEMTKPSGINCGMHEWKRSVRTLSEG